MENFKFGKKSLEKLSTVETELQYITKLALYLSPIDFSITSGLRTLEEQKKLVMEGKSQTLKSRHLLGEAVDFVPYINGKADWNDIDAFKQIADAFFLAAKILGFEITWGGNWASFRDYPHIQIELR